MKWLKDRLLWLYWNTLITTNWTDFYFGGTIASLITLTVVLSVYGSFSYIAVGVFLISLILFIKERK